MNCKNCKKQGCSLAGKNHEMSFECKAYVDKTNADRIRSMTDEELATYLDNMQGLAYINGFDNEPIRFCPNNYGAWLDWLKAEGGDAQ